MPDYKELYFSLMRETEKAIRTLIEAQQKCEELYLQQSEEERPNQIVSFVNLPSQMQKGQNIAEKE